MTPRFLASFIASIALVSAAFAGSETEPNDNTGQANSFSVPDSLQGGLPGGFGGSAGSDDYWSFSATSGVQYTFGGSSNGSFISPLDIGLEIRNGANGIIASVDANGDNQGETLNWTAPSTGTFYLVVYEATLRVNGISTYTIAASQNSDVSDWTLY